MEVHKSLVVPSTSIEPSSLDSQHFGRVCSQRYCGALLWPGSTSDICDRCLAEREVCNALRNPKDATRVYDATMAYAKAACSAPSPRNPLPSNSPYLLPSSLLEGAHNFEAGIGSKQPRHNSTSVNNQCVNPPNSTISVPPYNYNNLRHKSNVQNFTEEQIRTHHQFCGLCRAVIYTGTVCFHCHSDAAPIKEETGFERRDCLTEPKDFVSKSNLEDGDDGLSSAVVSILNLDENLDDSDDMDMEGIELSYPEVTDNGAVEEPKLQPGEEGSSCLKKLPPEKNPQDSNQDVVDRTQNRRETPRNTLRSLKLCSTMGCTGTILRESLAARCLECVRRDWKSKILKGHAGSRADDGRPSSKTIGRSIPKKLKTKKTVTWADEVSHSPASQQNLEYATAIKQLQPSSSKYGIHSGDFPIDDPPSGLNFQTTISEDVSVSTENISALASSTLMSSDDLQLDTPVKCVMPIESSAFLDISPSAEGHSGDDNESDKDIPPSDLQEVDPHLPEREAPPHSPPTKLTIRIPPRPGLYVQKCSSNRCEQRLPATYRWKLCMRCRARYREYQRRRQNQGRHTHLQEELLQSQITGSPLSSNLMNDGTFKQSLPERKAKSIPDPSLVPPPYPRYKAFPNLLADFTVRLNDFLHAQSIFFLYNEANTRFNLAKAIFFFDAEYSIVALDFDIVGDKNAVDANVLKLKREIERMGRIQFSPKRYISILDGGGMAERFLCLKQVPVLMTVSDGQDVSTSTAPYTKSMQGELEIAIVPDHSHPFLAGHRIIVRFRLLG